MVYFEIITEIIKILLLLMIAVGVYKQDNKKTDQAERNVAKKHRVKVSWSELRKTGVENAATLFDERVRAGAVMFAIRCFVFWSVLLGVVRGFLREQALVMHQVDASNPSPSERVRRGMRRIALVVAVPAAFLALGDLVMAIYFSDPAHWQSAMWFAAFAIGWFVFWIALSRVVSGFMQD